MSRRRATWKPARRWVWLHTVAKVKVPKVERKPVRIPKWRRYRSLPQWGIAS
jgi:hypothetical protein